VFPSDRNPRTHANSQTATYNRADYIERRRPMMAWWSEHIQKAVTGSLSASAINQTRDRNVVPIR